MIKKFSEFQPREQESDILNKLFEYGF